MKSFVVNLDDFFHLNRSSAKNSDNFDPDKRHLLIPMYQREYKWDKHKIQCLIRDIAEHEKFLGIIILDESDAAYEIVDGQQRITTCFLMLMAMYNLYIGHQREQQNILSMMQPYNERFVLSNDSVGDYISVVNGQMSLCIDETKDMYFQKGTFEYAYDIVYYELSVMKNCDKLNDFRQKFRDCHVLVMINEKHTNTQPIEQVFLDINEKSKLLDYEDIFKGYCFVNFIDDSLHSELRHLWAKLKFVSVHFRRFKCKSLSEYLYHYLLENYDKDIPENLSPKGIHILTGKTMDETEEMLKNMIEYGEKVLYFRNILGQVEYRFVDICSDSQAHSNTNDHISLKRMAIEILDAKGQVYQKLPFFVLIHALYTKNFGAFLTHDKLRRIFTNLYIYSSLFVIRGGKKSKSDIDHTVREALSDVNPVQAIMTATKNLRKSLVVKFEYKSSFKNETLEFVYSIIDIYNANQNWLPHKYSNESGDTLEHLIIPDNRALKVTWRSKVDFEFTIRNGNARNYKKCSLNYIIIPRKLNEDLKHDDIVSKISGIRKWYAERREEVPTHIRFFIEHIEELPTYKTINTYKNSQLVTRDNIESGYYNFIEEYFNDDNQNTLSIKLQRAFQESFMNNTKES